MAKTTLKPATDATPNKALDAWSAARAKAKQPKTDAMKSEDATAAWLASRRNTKPADPVASVVVSADPAPAEVVVDPVEKLAREICKTQGRDSNLMITYQAPQQIGTPEGTAYLNDPKTLRPMWHAYSAVARATLKLQEDAKVKV